jgi:CDP-glucose 4,6-dehydratase
MENPLGQRLRELSGPLLLTGHTGFKGTWITFLLEYLNLSVVGYSLPAEKNSLYDRAERTGSIPETFADIRDYKTLEQFIDLHKPSTIIHMAAQPLVLQSYEYPRETFDVNVMGTVNVLDIAFKKDFVKAVIVVTTDKVYRNDNAGRAFVETDPLEGKDPYSASKVGTEAVVSAWQQIAKISSGPKVSSVRAGNVIGGGDFADNRIIPDLIRAVMSNTPVEIRNPNSTRPWQHVLDPIHGYIMALEKLLTDSENPNYNFGPIGKSLSVKELIEIGVKALPQISSLIKNVENNNQKIESELLALDSGFSRSYLGWYPKWEQEISILKTFDWWIKFRDGSCKPQDLCIEDIRSFLN